MRRLPFLLGAAEPAGTVAGAASGEDYRRRARVLIASGAALCVLLVPAMHRPSPLFVWNVSASVPVGLYRIVPGPAPRVGELAAVRPSLELTRYMASRRYVEAGALLVKRVAAVAGQQVCRRGTVVTIDGAKVAFARSADRLRRSLPVWKGCVRMQAGTVFLLAPSVPTSFDGRYFGPVATTGIVGRAVPLWTWQ